MKVILMKQHCWRGYLIYLDLPSSPTSALSTSMSNLLSPHPVISNMYQFVCGHLSVPEQKAAENVIRTLMYIIQKFFLKKLIKNVRMQKNMMKLYTDMECSYVYMRWKTQAGDSVLG